MKRTADELATLSRLLDEALELPASQHEPWLASLTDEYAPLRDTLRGLLSQSGGSETSEFARLQQRIAGIIEERRLADAVEVHAGVLVGPYRLERELGKGGMGSVWLAERADQQPRRKVAVKLPHPGWLTGVAARWGRERDILASLEHPNIARLYDAGVDHLGRPYLAMEYVDGQVITDYCVVNGVELRRRLELILCVAAAVAYAHTRLVVHRDLKPSNVLVTKQGEVRLLDFGIAKLVQPDADHEDLTKLSGRAATLSYASPEQLRGEAVGTPSDVYSLGVVTFELLAGVRPYHLQDIVGVRPEDAIMRTEALPLSRAAREPMLRKQLRGDLDAILNKALKKVPAERYQTASDFSADIARYLNDLPVQARPDAFGYRARKFIARNVLQMGAGALVLTAIIAGASIAIWQAHQAKLEAARADQVKEFILSIFADADTDSGAGVSTTAADLLSAAQVRAQSELSTRPDVAVELMSAIGYGLLGQGRLDQAAVILREAVQIADRELGPGNPRTLAAKVKYGEALTALGEAKSAIALLKPLIAQARRQHAVRELVEAQRYLSGAEMALYETDAALAAAQGAVNDLPPATTTATQKLAADAWDDLAVMLVAAKRPGAVDAARTAIAFELQAHGDRVTEGTLDRRAKLGRALTRNGQSAEGMKELAAAITQAQTFLGADHISVRTWAGWLGVARLEVGDFAGAIDAFNLQLSIAQKFTDPNAMFAREVANCGIGLALSKARRGKEALPYLEAAAAHTRATTGHDTPLVLRSLSARALTLLQLGRLREAQAAFEALDVTRFAGTEKEIHITRQAALRSAQGRYQEAISLARDAATALQKADSAVPLADANRVLGCALLATGQADAAIAPLQEAIVLYQHSQIAVSPDQAEAAAALAQAHAQIDKLAAAG